MFTVFFQGTTINYERWLFCVCLNVCQSLIFFVSLFLSIFLTTFRLHCWGWTWPKLTVNLGWTVGHFLIPVRLFYPYLSGTVMVPKVPNEIPISSGPYFSLLINRILKNYRFTLLFQSSPHQSVCKLQILNYSQNIEKIPIIFITRSCTILQIIHYMLLPHDRNYNSPIFPWNLILCRENASRRAVLRQHTYYTRMLCLLKA